MRGRSLAIVVGVVVVVILLFWLMGGVGMMSWTRGAGMMGWQGYGSPWGGIMMLVVGVLVVGGIVWLVGSGRHAATGSGIGNTRPLDILKERYAKGEITREEYQRMRQELEA